MKVTESKVVSMIAGLALGIGSMGAGIAGEVDMLSTGFGKIPLIFKADDIAGPLVIHTRFLAGSFASDSLPVKLNLVGRGSPTTHDAVYIGEVSFTNPSTGNSVLLSQHFFNYQQFCNSVNNVGWWAAQVQIGPPRIVESRSFKCDDL